MREKLSDKKRLRRQIYAMCDPGLDCGREKKKLEEKLVK